MRVLFVTAPERGHFHVLLGPAQALVDAGHEVAFWSPRSLTLPHRCYSAAASIDERNRGAALAVTLADVTLRRTWVRGLLLDGVEADLAHVRATVRDFRPDVIACDPMVYAAPLAAHELGLPWVALSSSLNPVLPPEIDSELLATVRGLAADRDRLFAAHGLEARFASCDCLSPHATGVFATPALAGTAPPGVTLLGVSRVDARGDESDASTPVLDERPLVYVSLGSQNWYQPILLGRVFELFAAEDVQVVAAVGSLSMNAPSNVTLVPYADQRALLRRAHLYVTHAGANSVFEGLDAGVPLLMAPLVNDQPHNAWFVERAGAGRRVDFDRDTVRALLGDGLERAAAQTIGMEMRASDGATAAARMILGVV
ncbi:MAG: glycosyltransferase [Polyangia bacterium]